MLVSSRLLFVLWFQDNIKMVLDCEAEKKPYIHILDRWELRIFGPQWGDQHHPGETNVGSKSSGNVSETTTLWSFTVLSICQRTCDDDDDDDDDDVISGWLARFRPNYMYIYIYIYIDTYVYRYYRHYRDDMGDITLRWSFIRIVLASIQKM